MALISVSFMELRKLLAILIGIPIGFVLSIALISLAIAWRAPVFILLIFIFLALASLAAPLVTLSSFVFLLVIYIAVLSIVCYKLWNRSPRTLLLASMAITAIFNTLHTIISFLFIAALLVD